jgi:predicted RNA-binding Zn-ribbon protein involved in translation (DUF1610 family)
MSDATRDVLSEFVLTPDPQGLPLQQTLGIGALSALELAERYRRFLCPGCDTLHETLWQAEDCCPPKIEEIYECPVCDLTHHSVDAAADCEQSHGDTPGTAQGGPWGCPVCHAPYDALRAAVDCCLWKGMAWDERAQMVREVQTGRRSSDAFEVHP